MRCREFERVTIRDRVYLDVMPGASIQDVFYAAWAIAREENRLVEFLHNETLVTIDGRPQS